jgi:hypothetical protein
MLHLKTVLLLTNLPHEWKAFKSVNCAESDIAMQMLITVKPVYNGHPWNPKKAAVV